MQASYSELQLLSHLTETPASGFSDVAGDAIGRLLMPAQPETSSGATISK